MTHPTDPRNSDPETPSPGDPRPGIDWRPEPPPSVGDELFATMAVPVVAGEVSGAPSEPEPAPPPAPAAPVSQPDRIVALDVLRGFALLGILIMNISAFGLPLAAYANPLVSGDGSGVDAIVFGANYVFANVKFMSLFSMLFGVGILVMTSRAEARTGRSAALHYRRMLWLILIGMLHAFAIWYGDILVMYAECGLVIYLARKLSPKWLIGLGIAGFLVTTCFMGTAGLTMPYWPAEQARAAAEQWLPPAERVAEETANYLGGWWAQMAERVPAAVPFQTSVFLVFGLWVSGGLMLIGMALFKTGVLTGARSRSFYGKLAAVGLGLGLPLAAVAYFGSRGSGWEMGASQFGFGVLNIWAAPLVTLGYAAVLILLLQAGRLPWLMSSLSAVGQAAFSNYLFHSVACTTIFYGHGFGLYNQLERWQLALVVPAVWIVQIALSRWWLARYRFGPAEWLWRSLTYGKPQPMRRAAATVAA